MLAARRKDHTPPPSLRTARPSSGSELQSRSVKRARAEKLVYAGLKDQTAYLTSDRFKAKLSTQQWRHNNPTPTSILY